MLQLTTALGLSAAAQPLPPKTMGMDFMPGLCVCGTGLEIWHQVPLLLSLHLESSEFGKQSKAQVLLWDPSEQAGARDAKKESHSSLDDDKTIVK